MIASARSSVEARAQGLLGFPVRVVPCEGGRNSRVYRLQTEGGTFALKLYPDDGRDRAQREFGATTFLAQAGVVRVPRPVALDRTRLMAAYSWIEGEAVANITPRDIDLMADFAAELHGLRTSEAARGLPDAIEACFDEPSLLETIERRFDRLAKECNEPALREFLFKHFAPVLMAERRRVRKVRHRPLHRVERTLSPSDFGLHNALRTSCASIAFLDFEYFGWDDPVKLVADVCWHPAMELSLLLQQRFVKRCASTYLDELPLEERLQSAFALYGLRWCLIVLNEFVPAFWKRRVAAGMVLPAGIVRPTQLGKAYRLLNTVLTGLDKSST